MSLRPLLRHLADDPQAARLAREGGDAFVATALRPYVVAASLDGVDGALGLGRPALVVVGDDRQARELARDLRAWLHPRPVREYPSRGVGYESHLAPPPHLVGARIAALDALLGEAAGHEDDEPPVVVASVVALSELVPDPALRPRGMCIREGDLLDLDETAAELVTCGYARVDQVEDRGQFAIRGGILDLFAATEDHPVRIDLFDVEVESLRAFSAFTQRSMDRITSLDVAPAAELAPEHLGPSESDDEDDEPAPTPTPAPPRPPVRTAATSTPGAFGDVAAAARERAVLGRDDAVATPGTADDEGPVVPGVARRDVARALPVDRFRSFLDLLPADAAVVLAAEDELAQALGDHVQDVRAAMHDDDAAALYVEPDALLAELRTRSALRIGTRLGDQPTQLHAQSGDVAARSLGGAETELEKQLRAGYRTLVTWRTRGDGERAGYNLGRVRTQWVGEGAQEPDRATFAVAELRHGFVAPAMGLAVFPDHRLLRRRRATREDDGPRPGRRGALRSFADLRTGDVVVHEDHGIARFNGFETRTVVGVTRDYLRLEYAGEDRVFVPVDQLAKITRYVGGGGSHPPLSKLGGKGWETLKTRARKAAMEMAGELLELYAERRRRRGHAFPPDGEIVEEFERAFPHRETADQLDAIDAVKADMESARPMDRLICGDVGFGKTEVALRAAVKAASDGRQVLVLAPTTILAQQHYGTFADRLRDLPITVDHVSRFRSAKEQKAAIAAFNAGELDVLVGTHRILGRDVRGKELGLVVVDEEQRFGVRQKELLRQLKLRVDVIAMSATPIPRTLQMSLAGLRDITTIATPPEGRRPVKTFVGEYDDQLVRQALLREKERQGQAFFLHNRVESIEDTAARLRGLCPDLTFAVAHGQMDEQQLEERMLAFLRGEADVLVCTSIIESGIDIPQANTLVVDRADAFGLSQLYQIRGRVGRAREKGYAYLLYPSAAALTMEAGQRLAAISDNTELGSGFQVAMRDLELRGAGSLLGDEQTGHVAALGFELYLAMLEEAVAERGGTGDEDDEAPDPVRLDVQVTAYVPADYVPYEQAKVDVHRRIAGAREVAELETLAAELADRFGPVPEPLQAMLDLQRARIRLGEAGVRQVTLRGGRLTASPVELDDEGRALLRERAPQAVYEGGRSTVAATVPTEGPERLAAVLQVADALRAARPLAAA